MGNSIAIRHDSGEAALPLESDVNSSTNRPRQGIAARC
jgi:hypothetical protein